jgi:PAS domain-containing protein
MSEERYREPADYSRAAIRRDLIAAQADLDAALDHAPDRTACRAAARRLRDINARALAALGEEDAREVVGKELEQARRRILTIFGASGWDDV